MTHEGLLPHDRLHCSRLPRIYELEHPTRFVLVGEEGEAI